MRQSLFWTIPLLIMLLLAPFSPAIDMAISKAFYNDGAFVSNSLTSFIYTYGPWPAWIVFGIASFAFLCSYCRKKWKSWRAPALVLILTIALGAGFIVHTLLKDQWGRPRPRQVEEFGGMQQFRPFYKPNFFNQPEPSKSFSCGHCSMGFFFFAVALIGKRIENRSLYWLGMALAITLGIALSATRIAQGGHFFTDTVVTAFVMWITAYTAVWLIYPEQEG